MIVLRVAAILLLLFTPLVHSKVIQTRQEVVVLGDVHGAYEELTGLLRELDLIDSAGNWAGGKKMLVSLGDLIDRGSDSRKVLELIMQLQAQATAAGGTVEMVLGNHEVMVMTGDYRYVSDAEFASFRDLETPEDRASLKKQFEQLQEAGVTIDAAFDNVFPKGFMGLYRAYQPEGYLGRWLRQQPGAMIKLNDSLLVHGGVSRNTAQQGIKKINDSVETALAQYSEAFSALFEAGQLPFVLPEFDGVTRLEALFAGRRKPRESWSKSAKRLVDLRDSILFSATGPFWYRGNANCLQIPESYTTELVKKRLEVNRIVIGHTVKYRKVATRMGGDVIMLDTGMLGSYYKGTPSALLVFGSQVKPHHLGGKYQNSFFESQDTFKHNPSGMADKELENFLAQARVVSSKRIGSGITNSRVIELQHNDKKMRALFKSFDNTKALESKPNWLASYNDSDRYHYEVVSYKIDRALGLNMIPAAVIRTIDGTEGVVQYWVENNVTENERRDKNLGFHGYCDLSNYNNVRIIFDTLIYNVDRNNGNLLWDNEFQLTFIDHSQAFGLPVKKPPMYSRFPLRLSELFRKRIESLSDTALEKAAAGLLHPRQIESLKERRAFLLENARAVED